MKLINAGSGNAIMNDNEPSIVDTLISLTPRGYTIVAIDLAFYTVYLRKSAAHPQIERGYSVQYNVSKRSGKFRSCTVRFNGVQSTFRLRSDLNGQRLTIIDGI